MCQFSSYTHIPLFLSLSHRLNTIKAMEGGDWSEVIGEQTSEAIGAPQPQPTPSADTVTSSSSNAAPSNGSTASSSDTAAAAQRGEHPVVSPFTQASVHRTVGENKAGGPKPLTMETADQTLNEVRPPV